MKTDKVTLVIVTHRSTLLSAMDRVVVLRDGAIEKFGTPAEVLAPARPRTAEIAPALVAGQIHPKA
jgi:ABC-type protease/lipase transport system fused ATPase/permease subunit